MTPAQAQAQDTGSAGDDRSSIIVRSMEEAKQDQALADAVDAYGAIGETLGLGMPCDLHHLCRDEQYVVQVNRTDVQLFFDAPSQPLMKVASFPQAALQTTEYRSIGSTKDRVLDVNYRKLKQSLSVLRREAERTFLYRFPSAQDNPFLPWPVRTPSSVDDVTSSFAATGTLGEIANRIRNRIAPHGYDSLRYFSIPGGFAIATELERVGRSHPVPADDRWTRGKRGSCGSLYNYWTSLLEGENDRFRVFVFIVTDADIQPDDENASDADIKNWTANGRLALSRERASARALPNSRIWFYTYEFQASHSKGAELIANGHDALRNQQNKLAVGLP